MATTIGTYTSDVSNSTTSNGCLTTNKQFYPSIFGPDLAIPQWEAIFTAIILSLIILLTIIGNILVILSVFTYKPLRIVQNFFIVSLAVADLTVAILVLPLNVAYSILGKWNFGISLCKMWLTCDILCCTSSILNLCAIALDRYWAITDPINYAQKRTVERVLLLITGVWILSLVISSPPLIGWNDWPDVEMDDYPCQLTKQQGYVIYSSLGSFYIPLLIMSIVYLEIFLATKRRLRERANASRMNALNLKGHIETVTVQPDADPESVSDETNHNEHPNVSDTAAHKRTMDKLHRKDKRQKIKDSLKKEREKQLNKTNDNLDTMICENENSVTDNNAENSSESNKLNENGTSLILTDATVLNDKSKLTNKKSPLMPTKQSIKKPSVYQFIEEKQKISLSKERRAARTLGIIMGVFVVCWLPFFLMYVIIPFCSSCCPTDKFINFITWLGYINSALNPIIYTIFNLDYRRAFKKLLGIKN